MQEGVNFSPTMKLSKSAKQNRFLVVVAMLSSIGFQRQEESADESSVLALCFSSPSEQTSPINSVFSRYRNTEDSSPICTMGLSDAEISSPRDNLSE